MGSHTNLPNCHLIFMVSAHVSVSFSANIGLGDQMNSSRIVRPGDAIFFYLYSC